MGKRTNTTTPKGTSTIGGVPTHTTPTPNPYFTPPVKVTPQQRRGTSTVKHPVGVVWGVCLGNTHSNKGVPPTRATLMGLCVTAGVTYNTTRTQVQRYLQWFNGGCNPVGLPKGVVIPKGTKLVPPKG